MDLATAPSAVTAAPPPPATAVPSPADASAGPRRPEVVAAWPRSAQLAGAFLLGALATLLSVHAMSYLRFGAEPSEIDEPQPITYRVDLNEARRAELLQLPGIGPSLADRIEDYRKTQGQFRSVDDLRKIPGIGPTTLERLRPFVTVKNAVPADAAKAPKDAKGNKIANLKEPIDVNQASLAELQQLPGIGPKKAQAIIDEREKRPFAAVSELRRVSGIGPKTLEKITPFVTVGDKGN